MASSFSLSIRNVLYVSVLVLLVAAACASHIEYKQEDLTSEERLLQLFEKWAFKHSKNYTSADGTSQKHARFQFFKQNLDYIHKHNSNKEKASSYRLGLTRFADLTLDEFKARHFGFRNRASPVDIREYSSVCDTKKLPSSVDWRKHGAVTPVKDQGTCGSCWAFSTIGAIEGSHAIATGELVSLSEQELVSCVHTNLGCHGGLMNAAFKWVIRNGGVNTEEGYPYVSGAGRTKFCNWNKKMAKLVTIDGYQDVQPNNEDALICAVAQQPVSVAINANSQDFQLYAGGIFNKCSDARTDIDHAVLAVGYGSEGGKDYWIVKNSWTEDWGLDGYIHIERSSGNRRGVCGIHALPSYPVVRATPSASSI